MIILFDPYFYEMQYFFSDQNYPCSPRAHIIPIFASQPQFIYELAHLRAQVVRVGPLQRLNQVLEWQFHL